jgi:hypothetical protein
MSNITKQHIKISPKDETYFDAIYQYRHLLSEKSQNSMWDYGLKHLGFKPEELPKDNGISPERVRSERVRSRLMEILQNPDATNSERCYLAGFLGCGQVGCSEEEILEIIEQHNRWSDYLPSKTQYHVRKILDKIKKGGS